MFKKCHCDEDCFTYLNISTGVRTYKCYRPDNPCDFEEYVTEYIPKFKKIIPRIKKPPKKVYSDEDELRYLITLFKVNHKLALFVSIEHLCKKMNIPIFSPPETIPQFLERITNKI